VVSGTIRDVASHPVPYAYIFDRADGLSAVSDSSGAFQLNASAVGGIIPIRVRRLGFVARDTVLGSAKGNALVLDLLLDSAQSVDTISNVDASFGYFETLDRHGFYRRRSLPTSGIFLTADEIEKLNPRRTADVLRGLANVDVVSPEGSSSDEDHPASKEDGCALALVIDGKRAAYRNGDSADPAVALARSAQAHVSDVNAESEGLADPFAVLLPPELIAGLELYPVASTVPSEFHAYAKYCGVLVVWTKSH
jgi:hypothetical protein